MKLAMLLFSLLFVATAAKDGSVSSREQRAPPPEVHRVKLRGAGGKLVHIADSAKRPASKSGGRVKPKSKSKPKAPKKPTAKREATVKSSCGATCRADARCYAARYPDVGSLLCADGSPCLFGKLLNHYNARGRKQGRAFHCPATLVKRCKRLSSWAGTEERSALTEALSCHINASGVPHDVELRDAFCTSSYKKQLSTPPWPAFASGLEVHVHDSAGCDLHALGAHLEAQGQLQETCSDPPAAAASFSADAKSRVTSSPSLGIAESGLPRRPVLSVVVLIFRNTIKLWLMLESLARQQTSFPYEVVIADNGCDSGTASLVSKFEAKMAETNTSVRYLAICTNIGYAAGNNAGVASASTNSTEHLLFLNDDIELMPRFIQSLYELMTTHRPIGAGAPGAVGCKIVSQDGSSLLEAGSIMWADGSALGYGRGARPDAPEFSFVRPVDYISGACLLVPRAHFVRLGGFEVAAYKAYYEDTDLQMRIRYELNQTIWFQPLAVARHHEHGSFGTSATALMQASAVTFRNRWGRVLDVSHRARPPANDPVGVMRASDRRLDSMPAVLYIDVLLPRRRRGSGLPRALDNVLSLARLGYKVTVLGTYEQAVMQTRLNDTEGWQARLGQIPADHQEYDTWAQLRQAGVEVVRYEDVQGAMCKSVAHDAASLLAEGECAVVRLLFRLRPQYYAAIITSRPTEWRQCYTHLAAYCNKPDRHQHKVGVDGVAGTCTCPSGVVFEVGAMEGSNGTELACSGGKASRYPKVRRRHAAHRSTTAAHAVLGMGADCSAVAPTSPHPTCTLLYDAEALWFRRDERMVVAADLNKTSPATGWLVTAARSHSSLARSKELSLLYTADVIITVSTEEERYIKGVVSAPVVVVGHSPPAAAISAVPFESRGGILLIAGFNGNMYYNGDAAWYLVTQIYPLIAQAALRNRDPPIPLTIAGSGIPEELVAVVNASIYREHIRLESSPRSLTPLYDAARLTIIPHQYGCGTQYKLSEAMAIGLPAVVGPLASDGIGITGGVNEQTMWEGDFDRPLCVGTTTAQLATCAVRLHSDKQLWTQLRKGALHFSREIQSGDLWTRQLSQAVRTGLAR